jgi:hypothetical protein
VSWENAGLSDTSRPSRSVAKTTSWAFSISSRAFLGLPQPLLGAAALRHLALQAGDEVPDAHRHRREGRGKRPDLVVALRHRRHLPPPLREGGGGDRQPAHRRRNPAGGAQRGHERGSESRQHQCDRRSGRALDPPPVLPLGDRHRDDPVDPRRTRERRVPDVPALAGDDALLLARAARRGGPAARVVAAGRRGCGDHRDAAGDGREPPEAVRLAGLDERLLARGRCDDVAVALHDPRNARRADADAPHELGQPRERDVHEEDPHEPAGRVAIRGRGGEIQTQAGGRRRHAGPDRPGGGGGAPEPVALPRVVPGDLAQHAPGPVPLGVRGVAADGAPGQRPACDHDVLLRFVRAEELAARVREGHRPDPRPELAHQPEVPADLVGVAEVELARPRLRHRLLRQAHRQPQRPLEVPDHPRGGLLPQVRRRIANGEVPAAERDERDDEAHEEHLGREQHDEEGVQREAAEKTGQRGLDAHRACLLEDGGWEYPTLSAPISSTAACPRERAGSGTN